MNTQQNTALPDKPSVTLPDVETQTAVQQFAPSLTALYACQHAWERNRFFFSVVSPSFYSGWSAEKFGREFTIDSKIVERMDALEEVVTPLSYVLLHEPEPGMPVVPKPSLSIPKWVLPAGIALVAAGGILVVAAVAATAVVAAPVAVALADPAVVAILPTQEWVELCWYWNQ
jgi:hypothetical protein